LLFGFLNGLVNIGTIALVVHSKVVDRQGRKPLLLAGLVGMSASLAAVGAAVLLLPVDSTTLFATAAAAFVIFTNTFSATWGPVLWVMLAEIFPLAVRGVAMAIATLFNWLSAFVISLTFPNFVAFAGIGTAFIVFAVIGVLLFPVVWWRVPETKERSLESLEAAFRNGTHTRLTQRAVDITEPAAPRGTSCATVRSHKSSESRCCDKRPRSAAAGSADVKTPAVEGQDRDGETA
jgi:MFS family permease